MTEFGQQPEQQKLVVWDTIESRNREVADHYRAPDGTHWYWFVDQKSEDGLRNSRLCEPAREWPSH